MSSSSSRAAEYRGLVDGILADHAALVAAGQAGLECDEMAELRDMLARIERRMLANMPAREAAE